MYTCVQWRIQTFSLGRATRRRRRRVGAGCGEGVPLPTGDGVWGGAMPPPQKIFFNLLFKRRVLVDADVLNVPVAYACIALAYFHFHQYKPIRVTLTSMLE